MDDVPGQDARDETPDASPGTTGVDPFLAAWLNGFDAMGFSADLTITVSGMIISGTPMTKAKFLRAFGADLEEEFTHIAETPSDVAPSRDWNRYGAQIRSTMDKASEAFDVPHFPEKDAGERPDPARAQPFSPDRTFITLEDVTIWTPSGAVITTRYWRGQLRYVSGWFIGRPTQ